MHAALADNVQAVKLLLENGADVNVEISPDFDIFILFAQIGPEIQELLEQNR